jgi:hypothetical protein
LAATVARLLAGTASCSPPFGAATCEQRVPPPLCRCRVGYSNIHNEKLNTFQSVLVMDGWRNSFALLQYDTVEWTTGDKSGGSNGFNNLLLNTGTAACVGVNRGDGIMGYMHPNSLTTQIVNVATDSSSTGLAGRILLQVSRSGGRIGAGQRHH